VLLRLKVPGAWLAGLLFAVHPVAVESVAWITERKNTLPMALYLASLLAWQNAECRVQNAECRINDNETDCARKRSASGKARSAFHSALCTLRSAFCTPYYVLSLVLFLLALLAKTSVVMLPAVLLGCAWWRRGRVAGRDFLRALPFAVLAAALGLVTVWYQYHNAIAGGVVRTDGLAARAAGAGWAAWFYLYKALLPLKLCFVYPRWTTSASLLAFVPGLLFLGMLCLFARFRRSWGRPCLFALGHFLVALLPVLGFLDIYFMRYSLVADHWQYTALIGVVALVAGLPAWVMERPGRPARRSLGEGGWRTAAMAAAGALALACAVLTFRQTLIYHDEETLWRDTLAKNPKAWIASCNLGGLLARKAMAPGADSAALLDEAGRRCEEALRDLDQALAPKSYYAETYANRSLIYGAANRCAEALSDLDRAIALQPGNAEMYVNRCVIHAAAHRYAEAIRDCDQAIAFQPDLAEAWFNRGTAYARTGHAEEALRDLDQAIALQPNYAKAYFHRGIIHAAAHRYAEALRDYDQAIALRPDNADAHVNRGAIHAAANRCAEAIRDYDQAIALRPDNADAWFNRGITYAQAGRLDEALRDLDQAIALQPDDAQAYRNRGNIHAAAQRYAEAIADYTRAIRINPGYAAAYLNRATAYYTVKDYPRALSDARAAQRLGRPPNPDFLRALAEAAGQPNSPLSPAP
jgi:tetratricopeptide (TPR) repeat protein